MMIESFHPSAPDVQRALDGDEDIHVLGHIVECPQCKETYGALILADREMHAWAKTNAVPAPRPRLQRWIAAAAAVLVFMVAWRVVSPRPKEISPRPGESSAAIAIDRSKDAVRVMRLVVHESRWSPEGLMTTSETTDENGSRSRRTTFDFAPGRDALARAGVSRVLRGVSR